MNSLVVTVARTANSPLNRTCPYGAPVSSRLCVLLWDRESFLGRYDSKHGLTNNVTFFDKARVCERLVAISPSFRAAVRSRVAASASRIAVARAPYLPNRCGPSKADGEDCLKFLSSETWRGTSSIVEQMRSL